MSLRLGSSCKAIVFISLLLTLALVLTGCGSVSGNGGKPNPSPTPTPPGATPTPTPTATPTPSPTPTPVATGTQVVYEATSNCSSGNQACANGVSSDGVYAYKVDAATGTVSDVPGSPFNTGSHAQSVAALPSGGLVFVVDGVAPGSGSTPTDLGTNDIVSLRPDPVTGVLTKVATTPLNGSPADVVVHNSGKFLFTLAGGLLGFTIDPNSGALAPIAEPQVITGTLEALAQDPSGQFLYVNTTDHIYGFRIDQTTGILAPVPGSPFTVSAIGFPQLREMAIHPSGRFLYASAQFGNPGSFAIFGMALDPATGSLAPLPDSPYFANQQASAGMTFSRGGTNAYVSITNNPQVAELAVNTSTGTLTSMGLVTTPRSVTDPIVIDRSGQFVYVGSLGILGYRIQGDGTLQALPGFPHGNGVSSPGPHGIIVAPLP